MCCFVFFLLFNTLSYMRLSSATLHLCGNFVDCTNCVFSLDVMAAIFVSQNNETAAMFVSQTSPMGVELFSYVNALFCSNKFE